MEFDFCISLPNALQIDDEQFYELCQKNPEYQFELSAKGELIILPPTDGETGRRNMDLSFQLRLWERNNSSLGVTFDSSTCFKMPNGANRSPDAAWISRARWDALTPEEKSKFSPLCPDFVVEIRSPSDRLQTLREKMAEYKNNGAKLG